MRKVILFVVLVLAQNLLKAQPWMPATNNGPVKYADALARYREYAARTDVEQEPTEGKEMREDKDHLFEVWNYYWKMHLDKNGYMVPPGQTIENWQQYLQAHSGRSFRTTAAPANWVFQGPDSCAHGYSGLGRINIVAFDPVDSNTFYIGAAGSNTWKTTDGGNTWSALYSNLPMLGVADIKINALNHNTVYVATGDGDAGDAYSTGVIVSHDGGAAWAATGLSWPVSSYYSAHCLLINPQDTLSIMLASTNGLYRTHDAGATWTKINTGNFKQIIYNPGDTMIVYGTMYTDTCAQIMRSADGGNTWVAVTSFRDAQRINVAVCPATPSIVKALVSNNSSGLEGVYSSSDAGVTYTPLYTDDTSCTHDLLGYELSLPTTSCGGQGWYDLCIAMNPADPNQVTIGGVNTYFSADGGNSWTLANQWYGGITGVSTVHADKHCLAYNPLTGAIFETCDGGIYKNYGPVTQPWTDLSNGLGITEFYRLAVNNNVPFCIAGAQDNGTKLVQGGASVDLVGGDGMQPLINYADPNNTWYNSYQNGAVLVTRDAGMTWTNISDTIHSSGGWITPYLLLPTDTASLLMAYDQVYMTNNSGLSWTSISPVFDTNCKVDRMVMAPTNQNYIYVTYFDYTIWTPFIQYTTDLGVTWQSIALPFTDYISDLVVDPKDENNFWVTFSWYGVPKVRNYNLLTHSWINQTGTLPDIAVNCMVIDSSSLTKYVGTDVAVFYKDTTMTDWALYNTNLPAVHVDDMQINYSTNQLWAATFGRGIWTTTKADTPVTTLGVSKLTPGYLLSVYPNPASTQISVRASEQIRTVTITNILGQTVDTQTSTSNSQLVSINISGLPSGVYFVKVNGSEVRKFVKE
jgi:photosystem II stability/assembly factor-like uncharacterized protein